mgnify:FL=1|jgi:hypothetical protein|tara:strand:- start:263 stop:1624 length:1362 start_codon:yes stop_codon:yes gene_type:complete
MSSINTPTKFQIKLKEEHVVKGIKTLNETFFTLGNITNVDRRIVTVPGSTNIHLFDVNGVLPAAGTFPSSSMKYARISNLDTSYSLAVSFTSSKAPDGQGVTGTDISASLNAGTGNGGIIGLYTNVPTTASGAEPTITGSGMTLDITISSSLENADVLTTSIDATNCGIGDAFSFITPLEGGSGINATASVTIGNTDLTAPFANDITISSSDAYGYLAGDVLTIPAGNLGIGQLVTGAAFTLNGNTPTVSINVTRTFSIHTATGFGGTATVVAAGGNITSVTPVNLGTAYQSGQLVTISQQELTNQGFGTITGGDLTFSLTAGDVQNSSQVTLTALTTANVISTITSAKINQGGSGYEVGEEITVEPLYLGGANYPIFTLIASDFTENGPRSYWSMNLLPTSSLMFSSPEVTGSMFNGFWGQDIEFVSIMSNAGTGIKTDVEYVVVNSDNATS